MGMRDANSESKSEKDQNFIIMYQSRHDKGPMSFTTWTLSNHYSQVSQADNKKHKTCGFQVHRSVLLRFALSNKLNSHSV